MAITSDNMNQLIARSNVARSATSRSAVAPERSKIESNGRLVFYRAVDKDGDPIYTTATWTTGRE